MFIIASEQTRELDRLQKYLDKLGQPYRVFVTNLETDLDQQTESLATFFTQKDPASKIGKPLFFNDLAVPELWECWTLGITTYLFDGEERRANVVLREDILSRTVDRVEWFGQGEEIISIDVYNRYGWRSKRSLLTEAGQPYLDIYLNRQQEEVLLHFVSQGAFLLQTPKGRDRLYASKKELQRAVLEQVLPEDEAVLLMDKALLDVVKEIPKERLAYCASDANDLDEIKEQVSQILLVRWSVEGEKSRNHSLVRAGRCGAGKFSTRSPGHDGFSRGRRLISPGPSIPTSDLSHCCFDGYGSEIDRLSDSLQCAPLSRDFAGQI